MEPINKPERRKAFFNFMLLFLLCSAIIVVTVFAGASVPLKENNQLRSMRSSVEKAEDSRKEFTDKVTFISNKINELDATKPAEYAIKNGEITTGLEALNKLLPTEDNNDRKLFQTIISSLNLYHVAKKAEKAKTDDNTADAELKVKLKEALDDSKKWNEKWQECMLSKKS